MDSSLLCHRSAPPPVVSEAFQVGIEEEYFLACADTLAPANETPEAIFSARGDCPLAREMLQAQIEIATRPHARLHEARNELVALRATAAAAASAQGFRIMACGTHPMGNWRASVQTKKPRYDRVMEGLQMIGRRNLLCGMHVHVALPEPSRRVEVMTRALPYLPLLLALSASSPFWEGELTGLKGYRLAAYDELPRTGLPELFHNERDYLSYVAALTKCGAISDASHVWWSIRPSSKYPTLELRIADSCTRVDDSVALAALYRAIVRHLYLNPTVNQALDPVDRALAVENKWRAQRYGAQTSFVSRDGAIPLEKLLEDICENLAADIEALGCEAEIHHCKKIAKEGTSADRQIDVFRRHEGAGGAKALHSVCSWIADASIVD
jgi:carboxylate-amine ligase